jgi:uncharacterized protein YkwD
MGLNIIDVVLVLVVALGVAQGYRRGFIHGLLDLVRWVASILAGLRFYEPVARRLGPHVDWPEVWDRPAGFLLASISAGLFVHLLGHFLLLRRLPEGTHERPANRAFGMLPGFVSGLIAAAVTSALLLSVPLPDALREPSRESALANRLAAQTERLEMQLRPVFDEAIAQTLTRLTIRPGSDERVELDFKVEHTAPRPDLEARMLELVNSERAAAGLPALAPDPEMTEVARKHSADMFARGYFAHQTPEGLSPFDRMKRDGVSFRTAGENLALAPTLSVAHTGLMNSPGHRANILQPAFGRLGIGIMDGGRRGLMVTQNFRN